MLMSVAQSGFTGNFPYVIDHRARQIAYVIDRALRDGLRTVEVTAAAEAEWVDTIVSRSVISGEFAEQCTPGYYNNEGRPSPQSRQNGFFFGTPTEYVELAKLLSILESATRSAPGRRPCRHAPARTRRRRGSPDPGRVWRVALPRA
jgi:hypothetical protein